jgi:glycosyltransferase involved in cell wall biosynthesis
MISITLPSLHPPALERALDNIRATVHDNVEIIVVSPYEPALKFDRRVRVVWIKEGDSEGANAAHEAALRKTTGDFVLAWVDDHEFVPGWDEIALDNFLAREFAFADRGGPPSPFCLGLRQAFTLRIGTVFGNYYPYFPLMRRRDAARGLWLTGDYRVGFADCDLGMRVWSAGGRCEWSREPLVRVLADDARKMPVLSGGADWIGEAHTTAADMALFLSRWANRYGAGYDVTSLRGFNVDVPLDMLPAGARTIWKGKPQ